MYTPLRVSIYDSSNGVCLRERGRASPFGTSNVPRFRSFVRCNDFIIERLSFLGTETRERTRLPRRKIHTRAIARSERYRTENRDTRAVSTTDLTVVIYTLDFSRTRFVDRDDFFPSSFANRKQRDDNVERDRFVTEGGKKEREREKSYFFWSNFEHSSASRKVGQLQRIDFVASVRKVRFKRDTME